jgi:hypothetical protein
LATQEKRTREEEGREIVIPSSVASKPRGPLTYTASVAVGQSFSFHIPDQREKKEIGLNSDILASFLCFCMYSTLEPVV